MKTFRPAAFTACFAAALFPASGDTQQSGVRQSATQPAYTAQAVHRPAAEIPHLDRILPAGTPPRVAETAIPGQTVVNTVVVTKGQPSARYAPAPVARATAPVAVPPPAPKRSSVIAPTTIIPEDAPLPAVPTTTVRAAVPTAPAATQLATMQPAPAYAAPAPRSAPPATAARTAPSTTSRATAAQAETSQPEPLAAGTSLGKTSATAQAPRVAVAQSAPVVAASALPPPNAAPPVAAKPVAAKPANAPAMAAPAASAATVSASSLPVAPATAAPAPEAAPAVTPNATSNATSNTTSTVAAEAANRPSTRPPLMKPTTPTAPAVVVARADTAPVIPAQPSIVSTPAPATPAPAAPPAIVVKSHAVRVLKPVPAGGAPAVAAAGPAPAPQPAPATVAKPAPEVVERQYRSSTSMFAITPDAPAVRTAPVQVGLGRPKDNPYAPQPGDDSGTIDLGRPTSNPYAPQTAAAGSIQEPSAFANGKDWEKLPAGPKKTVPRVQAPGLTSSQANNNSYLAETTTPITGMNVTHVDAGASNLYSAPSSFPGVRTSTASSLAASSGSAAGPAMVVQPRPDPSTLRPAAAPLPEAKPLLAMPYSPSLDLTSLDKSVDPCNDFYQYTCGGWEKNNPIPADQAAWSVYAKLGTENTQYLWGILQEDARPSATRTPVQQKIGDYFKACMNTPAIDHEAETPVRPSLARIAAIQNRDEIFAAIPLLQRTMLGSYFYDPGTGQDAKDASVIIVEVNAGGLGLPDRDYYLKQDARSVTLRQQYTGYIQRMFELVGASPDLAGADADSVLRIETALAQASLTRVQRRDPHNTYHPMSVQQLIKLVPSIDWLTYFSLEGATQLDTINVSQPAFLQAVQSVLVSEPVDALKAYLAFHALTASAPYLASPFAQANFQFYSTTLRGVPAMPPRWKTCTRAVDRNLGEALGQEFVARTFSADTKAKTQVMTEQIEAAMQQEIEGLTWMSPSTKAEALRKLHAIRNKIGYPDTWRDYSGLQVKRDDYFGDVLRSARFEEAREWHKLGKPVDKNEWGMTPPTVNAYFNPQMNDINFPAGVLQPPLYDPKMDDAPNYGNTGATIGHELTHAFDDEGRQFDAQGNLRDWWTPADAKGFEDRINCDRRQYAGYTVVDDIHINSKLTSGEDVADLGGTLLAYMAWKKQTAGQTLGDVDGFTPDQRFFIGMAQWACENQRPENLRLSAATNPHSPGFARINGVVSNMPEFQKAFGCKVGQPMVHTPSCKVW